MEFTKIAKIKNKEIKQQDKLLKFERHRTTITGN